MALTKISIHEDVMRRIRPLSVTVERIDTELLAVVKDISQRGEFLTSSSTIPTVSGTAEYTISSDVKSITFAQVSGGDQLRKASLELVNQLNAETTTNSTPVYFAQLARMLRLYPTPDAVYTINYRFTKIHGDTITTLEFHDMFRECVVQGVIAMLFTGQLVNVPGSYDRYQIHSNMFMRELDKMIANNYQDAPVVQYQGL